MTALLIIIYIAFISLGLPDSLLGSAWPSMFGGLGVSLSDAGLISMIITAGTVASSIMSDRLIRRLGTGRLTLISVTMTAAALVGISISGSYAVICLLAVPLGLGAGSVDAGLNNFVALHYRASHMSWLHCFWGIGASVGPVILSALMTATGSWRPGYRAIGMIQLALSLTLLFTLPLWKKAREGAAAGKAQEEREMLGFFEVLRLKGARGTLLTFFCYCSVESTIGLWGSSFLVAVRGLPEERAAMMISLFYIGITAGRGLSGFLSMRLSQKSLIRAGQAILACGVICFFIPLQATGAVGLLAAGLGCAPIFPGLLHETPNTFGQRRSQSVMGIQMASAYIGSACMPPLFGFLASFFGYELWPFYLVALTAVMIVSAQIKAAGCSSV